MCTMLIGHMPPGEDELLNKHPQPHDFSRTTTDVILREVWPPLAAKLSKVRLSVAR